MKDNKIRLISRLICFLFIFNTIVISIPEKVVHAATVTSKTVLQDQEIMLTSADLGYERFDAVCFESLPESGGELALTNSSIDIRAGDYFTENRIHNGEVRFKGLKTGTYSFNVRWGIIDYYYRNFIPYTEPVKVTIEVINKAPTNLRISNTNAPAGYEGVRIANLSADDPYDTESFSIVEDSSDLFEATTVDGSKGLGNLKFKEGKTLSVGQTATVTVRASDKAQNYIDNTFTITGVQPEVMHATSRQRIDFKYTGDKVDKIDKYMNNDQNKGGIGYKNSFQYESYWPLEERIQRDGGIYSGDTLGYYASGPGGIDTFAIGNKYYVVELTDTRSTNADLKSLALGNNISLSPEFTPENTSYKATVPYNIVGIAVYPTVSDDKSNIKIDGKDKNEYVDYYADLKVGTNNVNIEVTSENGTKKNYTIEITRKESDNAYLRNIVVDNYNLSPNFNREISEYTVNVPSSIYYLEYTPYLEDFHSVMKINGYETYGYNSKQGVFFSGQSETVNINITAPDGTVREYKILFQVISLPKHKVTFVSNGDTDVPVQNIEVDQRANKPFGVYKEGYDFDNWYSDEALTTPFDFNTPITQDITLYGKWNKKTGFKVEAYAMFGTITGNNEVYSYGDTAQLTAVPNRGYAFDSWFDINEMKVVTNPTYSFKVTKNNTLYAYFTELPTFNVKFMSSRDTEISTQKVPQGDKLEEITNIDKEGCNFEGWYLDEGYADKFDINSPIVKDMTLYGKWSKKTGYKVNISSVNGNVDGNMDSYTYGDSVKLSAIPNNGYEFVSWEEKYTGTIISTNNVYSFNITSNRDIIANFKQKMPNVYTVKFTNESGQILSVQQVTEGDSAVPPLSPSKPDNDFIGWDTSYTNVKSDLTIKPLYKLRNVKYRINVENGTISSGILDYSFDSKVTVNANQAPEGKSFSYWMVNGLIVSYEPTYSFAVTGNTTITAVYSETPIKMLPTLTEDKAIVNKDTKKISFISQVNIPTGYTMVECGLVLLKSQTAPSSLDFNTLGVVRAKSSYQNTGGQYMMNKTNVALGDTWYARAYLIYKDNQGNVYTLYSNIVSATME
ncbi:InlB B-repeat-containing protein [Clostridium sp. YIM B02505]|uniref:InlB B-repeat-containing protein n=1 Tax=Clostridium yunnanense TaxID=2800325 RepID=A0ABS1ER45_9CLOT|nr:InlB B-repeat-containing protein [Clostridium yunnanense]MBK1811805.1 InlB B-repeat-containing protein [Clostridium yunnanense]